MRTAIFLTVALPLALASAPAAAQNGAMWVDKYGRMMSFEFAGASGAPPAPRAFAPADMAGRFKALCMSGDTAAAARAAGLAAASVALPMGKKAPAVSLDLWQEPGLVVSRTQAGFAGAPAQCNVTYYVNALPDAQAVAAALAAVLGSPPSNAADAIDKKGRPRKFHSPEWRIGAAPDARIVAAHVVKGSQYMPGSRVQISVRAANKAGK